MEKAFNTIVTDAAPIDADEPWKAPNAAALDKRTLASWIDGLGASPLCKQGLHKMMMADNGMVTEWQSYLGNLAMVKGGGLEKYWSESEVYRCQGGNQQLARKLADAIGPAKVMTRTIVRSITVTDRNVRVVLGDGKVLEGDHVVLSAPPPTWNRIAFDPALPPGLAPQMGSNVKFLMAVNGPFWRRAELGPEMFSDGPVSSTWHGTDGQRGAGEALVAFSGGTAADACREWSATERNTKYLAEIQKIYKGIRPSFVRARFMDWPSDPWVEGVVLVPRAGTGDRAGPDVPPGDRPAPFRGRVLQLRLHGLHGRRAQLGGGGGEAHRVARRRRQGRRGMTRQNVRLFFVLIAIVVAVKDLREEREPAVAGGEARQPGEPAARRRAQTGGVGGGQGRARGRDRDRRVRQHG